MWRPYQSGTTIGQAGSEGGVIVQDDEHVFGARITLEQCERKPFRFAITCGIYLRFFHTHYCGSEREARTDVERMKTEIQRILDLIEAESTDDDVYQAISDFTNRFPT